MKCKMADNYDWLDQLMQEGLVKEHDVPAVLKSVSISNKDSDSRPFPIQAELSGSIYGRQEACTIPWWLAEQAYLQHVSLYGKSQSLKRIAERGGFGRNELLLLLRCSNITTRNRDQRPYDWSGGIE